MKQSSLARSAVLASLLAVPMATAQAGTNGHSALFQQNDDEDDQLNSFSLGYSMGLNITAGFKNVSVAPNTFTLPNQAGIFTPMPVNPGTTNGLGSHVYDNGYSLVDATGNAGGFTSYWGYQNAGQVQNGTVVMNALQPNVGAGPQGLGGDPQHGVELTYRRQLGRHDQLRWGLEAGFGFTDISFKDTETVSGDYILTSDAYTLPPNPVGGGVVSPPPPPYHGPFSAPPGSPVISDTPNRTITPVAGTDEFDLHANVFSWRLGPYVRFPLFEKRLAFSLSGGAALFYVNSHFSYHETVSAPALAPLLNSGSGSHSDILAGGYMEGDLAVKLTHSTELFTGVRYVKVSTYSNTQGGKQAQLDFGNSLFVALGLTYKF